MVRVSALTAVLALGIGGGAIAVAADPPAPVPPAERTQPRIRPTTGTAHTRFVLRFTLRRTAGHQGFSSTTYRVGIERPRGAPARCEPLAPAAVVTGAAGSEKRVVLQTPRRGWCLGRFAVTVYLIRGPYCAPPVDGGPAAVCPLSVRFVTQELPTGTARFRITRRGPRRG